MLVSTEEIRQIVLSTKVIKNASELQNDSVFQELGVDSLDVFSILLAVEERYDFSIPDSDTPSLNSVNEIVRYVSSRLQVKD